MERPRRQDSKEQESGCVMVLLKCLLLSYIVTGALLMLLALGVYKLNFTEKIVSVIIIAIYVMATFLAGWVAGKRMGSRKFIWGLIVGSAYFAVLAIVSVFAGGEVKEVGNSFFTTLILCAAGGMLGGMFG